MVRSSQKKPSFGFEFYSPPKNERLLIPPRSVKIGKLNIPNFAEQYAKTKAFVPAPSAYNTSYNWSKMIDGHIGKFMKKERITVAGEILKNKDKGTPSPS